MTADTVEPYVSIKFVGNEKAPHDIKTGKPVHYLSCKKTNTIRVSSNTKTLRIRWSVAGAFTVDMTRLVYSKWKDVPRSFGCHQQVAAQQYNTFIQKSSVSLSAVRKGGTRWKNPSKYSGKSPPDPLFSSNINLSQYSVGDEVVVYAVAKVDQQWKNQPTKVQPNVGPQTHIVNARTNPRWFHRISNGKFIRGRLHWISMPITLLIV
uniref:Uncharacterized protein n=2 Tax=Corethron hystrix TaxID=216773 RepID=A0A7S1BLX6_9STRA|mmetsp:Transcript_3090/g.5795  ORF Transcript_3090/g.5795 Transcript_3090/m.5795 type:complete len:207 (+) Transcript_3090:345-965(+)